MTWSSTTIVAEPTRCSHHRWKWDAAVNGRPALRLGPHGHGHVARIICGRCDRTRYVTQGYVDRVLAGGRFA